MEEEGPLQAFWPPLPQPGLHDPCNWGAGVGVGVEVVASDAARPIGLAQEHVSVADRLWAVHAWRMDEGA